MISLSETICVLSRVYTPWAYTRACARIRRLSAQLFILLSPVAPSAYASIRRVSPLEFKHVELSRPAQTSTVFPANHESTPRSPRADALFCIGTYVDVYRRISSRVYTFIHGTTFAMQWRRPGKRKRRQLHRLPAHTRAGSINPALHENQPSYTGNGMPGIFVFFMFVLHYDYQVTNTAWMWYEKHQLIKEHKCTS